MRTSVADSVDHKLKDRAHKVILSFVNINTSGGLVTAARTYQQRYGNAQALAFTSTEQKLKQRQQFAVMINNRCEHVGAWVKAILVHTRHLTITTTEPHAYSYRTTRHWHATG